MPRTTGAGPHLSGRQLTQVDREDVEYLKQQKVPETLEAVTRALLAAKPQRPVDAIVGVLKDMRVQAKSKQIENFMGNQHEMSADARREVDHQVSAIVSLERDESIKSDGSTFSVNSLDMAEFISEFRQAYAQLSKTRVLNGKVTKEDLGDVIDLVAFPTPEKILAEMFNEVDEEKRGAVEFEECLARMTYKIQGRFHRDTLSAIYDLSAGEAAQGGAAGGLMKDALPAALSRLGLRVPAADVDPLLRKAGVAAEAATLPLSDFVRVVYIHTGHEDHLPVD